jgi:transcription elongation GreA/GreB family factor
MDKKALLSLVIKEIEKEKERLGLSLKEAHQAAIDAPGAMQSKSDTTKFQMNLMVDRIKSSIAEKDNAVYLLKRISDSLSIIKEEVVGIGSLVNIERLGGKHNTYFILPAGGGTSIEYEGKLITVISKNAPITSTLLNKKKGDVIGSDKEKLTVIDLQ